MTREKLTPRELAIMEVVWDRGEATVRDVHEALSRRRKVAYTTALTFLTRLEQKGFVKRDKSDLAYVYRAAVTRNQVTRSRLRTMRDELFDGDAAPLVLQLMKTERFSHEEIAELQILIDQHDSRPAEGRR